MIIVCCSIMGILNLNNLFSLFNTYLNERKLFQPMSANKFEIHVSSKQGKTNLFDCNE